MMVNDINQVRPEVLQGLLAGIEDGVILTDGDERILYLNKAARRILHSGGELSDDARFADICPLVNIRTGKTFASPLAIAMQEQRTVHLAQDMGVVLADGPVYLAASCSPLRQGEQVTGCSVIFRDVTALRRLEMKGEADYLYMRSVFTAATIGLCVLDADGAILEINDAALETMATNYKAAIGLQFGDAFRCENSLQHGCGHGENCRHCPVRKNIEAAILDDDFSGEFTVAMRHEQSSLPVWLKVFVSQSWLGTQKRIIVAMVDVTRRKLREKEILNVLDAVLRYLSQEQGSFYSRAELDRLRRLKEGW